MKILLVSWSLLPQVGGSSIIVESLAQHFDRSEMVVLGSTSLFRNTRVNRAANAPKFNYFLSDMYIGGRGYRYFEWFRKRRFQPLIRKIRQLIKEEQVDRVIGVYPNPLYCLAACRAAAGLGVPFYAYFHNTYTENTAISDPEAPAIQREIFEQSRIIFVMSKGMQSFYQQRYPGFREKFRPLVHTFNEFPSKDTLTGIPGTQKAQYRLVGIGNFNESNMEATRRLVNSIKENPQYSLSLFTHVPGLLLQKRGLDIKHIDHRGFLPADEVHQALQAYDIGVLTHGFKGSYGEVEYQTIFPTRTIPLLLAGKPILVHSPPGSFLNTFVQEQQCGHLIEEASEAAILDGLHRIVSDASYQEQLVRNARQTAALFYGPDVAQQLRRALQS